MIGFYVTGSDLGELLQVDKSTIRNNLKHGRLPPPDVPARGGRAGAWWHITTILTWLEWFDQLEDFHIIGEWFGVSHNTIRKWATIKPMPTPAMTWNNKKLWHYTDVQEWASNFVEWEEKQ